MCAPFVRHLFILMGAIAVAAATAGCAGSRSYNSRSGRISRGTAYVLPDGQFETSLGLLGFDYSELGASLGVGYGIADVAEVRLNTAHAMAGILSVQAGANLVDTRHFGLGLDTSVLYARGSSIWALPDDIQDPINDVSLLIVPVRITSSAPLTDWCSVHLGLSYVHAEVFGPVENDSTLIDAGVGLRIGSVVPSVHLYANGWLAFKVGADLPFIVFGQQSIEAISEIEPGVRAGVRSAEWISLPVEPLINVYGSLEMSLGRRTTVEVSLVRNAAARIIELPVLPSLLVVVRI